MKIKILLIVPIILGSIALIFILILKNNEIRNIISEDGPVLSARDSWEYLKLRDPKTGFIPKNIRTAELEFAKTLPGSYYSIKFNNHRILSYEWTKRGPYEIGGRTRALALDVRDENIILGAGVSSGIWRSTDGGKSWKKVTKPDQLKSISCIAQDTRPGREHIWYAGTGEFWGNSARISGDGIYKSTDGGLNWFLLPSTSTNRPNSWENPFDYIWSIIINPTAPLDRDEVYASTTAGAIVRSTDGGMTWKVVLGGFGNNYSFFTEIAVTSKGLFYATLSQMANQPTGSIVKGIYRSTDGENWTNITPDFMPELYRRIVIAIAPSNENQVFFAAETPQSGKETTNSRGDRLWHSIWKYKYISGDGTGSGGQWIDKSAFVPKPDLVRGQMNSQGSYNLVIKVHPTDTNIVFLGGVNLYRSDDGFSSNKFAWIGGTCPDPDDECWYHYRYPNQHADQHAIVFLPSNPYIMFTSTDGGVHKTLNDLAERIEWISLNNGYFTTQFYTCAIDNSPGGGEQVVGGTQDNGTLFSYTSDLMTRWTTPSHGDGLTCKIADGGKIIYTSQNTSTSPVEVKMWRILIDDKGNNIIKTRIDPAGGLGFIWNHFYGLDPNDNKRMYVGGGKIIWRNNNLDEIPFVNSNDSTSINWDSLSNTRIDLSNPVVTRDGIITAGDISKKPANILYYGTSSGEVFRLEGANIGNPIPKNITGKNFPQNAWVSCIEIDPEDADELFVVFSNYNVISIFHTTNGGNDWTPVAGNLEEFPSGLGSGPAVHWLEILPINNKRLYLVGTSTGLYSTAYLNGIYTVWRQEGAETIGNTVVKMIDARPYDGFTAVGTHGLGIFNSYIKSLPPLPESPELIYPAHNQGAILDTTTFVWRNVPEASFYKLEIASDINFDNIIMQFNGIRSNQYFVQGLPQGRQKLYWRVKALSSGGESISNKILEFITAITPPALIYPEQGATNTELNITLKWEFIEFAKSYRLQVSDRIVMTNPIIDTVLNDTQFEIKNLNENQRYNWRLASIDEYGQGHFSETFNFRTKSVVSVPFSVKNELTNVIINPIPANTHLNLHYTIAKNGFTRITLFNITGQKIRTLLNTYQYEGLKTNIFDISSIPSGIYSIVIEHNEAIIKKNVIIVR